MSALMRAYLLGVSGGRCHTRQVTSQATGQLGYWRLKPLCGAIDEAGASLAVAAATANAPQRKEY